MCIILESSHKMSKIPTMQKLANMINTQTVFTLRIIYYNTQCLCIAFCIDKQFKTRLKGTKHGVTIQSINQIVYF